MNAIDLLRDHVREARVFLEETVDGVTPDQIAWSSGVANPIGATYAHVIFAEDVTIQAMLQQVTPLSAGAWAGRTGVSEPPPDMGGSPNWAEWSRSVKIDFAALRRYGAAVRASSDGYLATLTVEDLEREFDLTALGLGRRSLSWMLYALLISNPNLHCGEIACLKGLQGAKGYAF